VQEPLISEDDVAVMSGKNETFAVRVTKAAKLRYFGLPLSLTRMNRFCSVVAMNVRMQQAANDRTDF
jgi:hypothetical protein